MISLREATSALYGAWRLARRDLSGMNWFDISVEGFWRSFWAAAVAFPFYLLLVVTDLPNQPQNADLAEIFLVRSLGYGMAWIAFPLAALPLTRLIDRSSFYIPLIIALNWAAVLQTAALTIVMLFALPLPADFGALVTLIAYGVILYYAWFVTRTALDVGALTAIALVIIDILLAMLIYSYTSSLLGPTAA